MSFIDHPAKAQARRGVLGSFTDYGSCFQNKSRKATVITNGCEASWATFEEPVLKQLRSGSKILAYDYDRHSYPTNKKTAPSGVVMINDDIFNNQEPFDAAWFDGFGALTAQLYRNIREQLRLARNNVAVPISFSYIIQRSTMDIKGFILNLKQYVKNQLHRSLEEHSTTLHRGRNYPIRLAVIHMILNPDRKITWNHPNAIY